MKRCLMILSSLLLVLFVAGLFVGNFFYNLAINPHGDKSTVTESEVNTITFDRVALNVGDEWMLASGYETVHLQSFDGLQLRGYEILNPSADDRWVILSHGYGGHARQLGYYAMHFYEMGYSIFLPDARGHGGSEGDYIGMGVHDRLDLVDWVQDLSWRHHSPDIVLFGVSMGGATVMAASGESLPANVKAVVEDCGYTSVDGEFAYQLNQLFGLPPFPVIHFASLVTKVRAGWWLGEASAASQLQRSTTPTLFVHGSEDTFVPFTMLAEAYDACAAPKQMLVIEGAGHGGAATTDPALYWNTVETFLNQYV